MGRNEFIARNRGTSNLPATNTTPKHEDERRYDQGPPAAEHICDLSEHGHQRSPTSIRSEYARLQSEAIWSVVRGSPGKTYMVRKYALETQMKFSPPPKSATSDGITVEVTVASRAVRRLTRERTTRMAQNLGPFWNFGGFFSVVASWASVEDSFNS